MFARTIIAALTLSALVASAPKAAEIERTVVANWYLGAYTNDQNGEFSHCAIVTPYKSGIYMTFAVDRRFQWSVGFYNPAWVMTPGTLYHVVFWIDNHSPETNDATAISPTFAKIPLEPTRSLFEQFRRGYRLSVSAAGQMFYFNLDGTARALNATLSCTQRHVLQTAGIPSVNPIERSGQPVATKDTAATKAEATALIANILSSSGISGFYILPPGQVPKELASYDAVWVAPNVVGTLMIAMPTIPVHAQDLASLLLASDAKSCAGKFASGSLPASTGPSLDVHLFTACDASAGKWTIYYDAVSRQAGGYYLFAVMNMNGDGTPARTADTAIRVAVFKVIRK